MKYEIEIEVNQGTLEAYGEYVDYVYCKELGDTIRVVVKKGKEIERVGATLSGKKVLTDFNKLT